MVITETPNISSPCGDYIFITDSAFNSHPGHSRAVARAFRASGLRIPWGAFFAPLAPESGYFALMAEAGCKHVEFGTESMSGPSRSARNPPIGEPRGRQYWAMTVSIAAKTADSPSTLVA